MRRRCPRTRRGGKPVRAHNPAETNRAGDLTGYVYETLSRVSNICHVLTGCPIKRSGAAHNCPFSTPRKKRPRPGRFISRI